MKESEWLSSTESYEMLGFIRNRASEQQFRLFSIACCRRTWPHITDWPPSAVAQSKGAGRRFLRWRHVLLGIVCLSVVFALALYIWIRSLPPFWWLDHDKVMYTRISKAIAADPRPLWDKRLYDFIRELDLEDIPWVDANVQNQAGSFRIYHFRGFMLSVNLYVPERGPHQGISAGSDSCPYHDRH
jgi:hypothetical protein